MKSTCAISPTPPQAWVGLRTIFQNAYPTIGLQADSWIRFLKICVLTPTPVLLACGHSSSSGSSSTTTSCSGSNRLATGTAGAAAC